MSGLSAAPRGAPPESSPPAPGGLPPDRAAATGAGHAGAFGRLRPALFRAAACLVVAAAAFLALPGGASAQENPVRESWSLTPSGLSEGDRFRLIFVTSTEHNATSSDIGVYNTFVQEQAAAGHMAIRPYSSQFRVVGSTRAVDARDNTNTTGTGVPIYWLNGNKVANNYADFYDGSWRNEGNAKNQSGTEINPFQVFTGSDDNGTASTTGIGPLGHSSSVRVGKLNNSNNGDDPIRSNTGRSPSSLENFYGLSPVFTVKEKPSIDDVSVTSRPADGTDTFKHGERVEITVTFDEAVEVRNKGTGGGNVYINVAVGNEGFFNHQTNFSRQDHPRKLVFAFTVTVSHVDGNGFCIGSACGNDNIKLQNTGAIVATADDVAARRGYGAVQTSWKLAGGRDGLTGGVCDRQHKVRDAIVAKLSAADTCDEVTDAQVNAIGSLDLSGESIGSLHKRDFEGLTALHTLDLSNNALDHLPGDLFEPLDDTLRTLKLNRNPLGALPAGLFDGLTGIRTLDLAVTGLSELPAGLFADLDRLETLRLVENRLRAFPAAALADVSGTLEELFMRDNDIASIAAGDLDGFGELRRLALSDNALASLPAGLFDDATELYELKLDGNALASLPDDLLSPLTKLQTVWLGGNPGFDGFAPAVEAIPAQSVERSGRADLAAETGTSPWGDNVTWSWTQTDSSGTTVTLNDADTATPWFRAPSLDDDTVLAFEATATGRGTSGGGASEGAATAQVTVPGAPSIVDVSVTSRPRDGTNTFKRRDHIEITATFSEPVRLDGLVGDFNTANIIISIERGQRNSTFHRQDHPNRLIFRYAVAGGDSGRLETGASNQPGNAGTIVLSTGVTLTARSDGANARRGFNGARTSWRIDGGTVAPTGGVCDRQHKVRDAIVAAVSAADTCADVTDTHLAGIASLDLSGEAIGSLHKRDFEGLAGLTELNLSGNALDYLPGNLFDHVATLTGLKLNANAALAALPARLFRGLAALEELELRANALTALPAGVFDGLTALQGLDLRRNGLTALRAAVFGDLTELRRLKLAQNALASLPDGVFGALAKLEDGGLSLGDNPGAADFVPQIAVGAPAQTVRPGVRVDLEATVEPNPWGSNLLWSWARTDTGSETVTLEDDDTRTAHFVAPALAVETEFAFQVTATGRGTAGVANPRQAIEDAAVTVLDTTGPELVSAEVEVQGGFFIDILFSEPVDFTPGTNYPQLDDNFTVNVDGVELAVTNVKLLAGRVDVVRLTLSGPISQDQIVTLSYAVPATGKLIEDIEGNDAPAFTDVRVTNNSTVANTTPPVPRRAEVMTTGTQLALTFNEDLDLTGLKLPPASAFTITADGDDVEVLFVSTGLADVNRVVNLHAASGAIGQRQTVTVSYAAPTDGSEVIEDVDGNDALSFADFEVVNNSTVFLMDATGTPTISGVPQVGNTLRADISGIEDDEGLPATLTYRWVRVPTGGLGIPAGTDIGTDSSYTVSSADVGSTIRVEVSFTDGEGNPEGPLASDAVPAVAAAGACPAGSDWRATMTMGYRVIETGSTRSHEFGFTSYFGALDPATIPYATGYPVKLLARFLNTSLDGNTTHTDSVSFAVTGGDLPDGTVLNLGATMLTVGTDSDTSIAGQEQWNLQTLGLSPTWVGGQELTVCANLAPVLESAKANGTSLVLTYAEALDTGSTPAPGAYSVTVAGGADPAVSDVSVSGRTVTLTLAAAVTAANSVTLTYTPGSNPVQDVSGLDAPGFSNRTVVVNNDATGTPTISGAPQVGGMLTADVSAIGDADGLPSAFDYRWVRVSGGTQTDIGTNMSRYSPRYADVGSTIGVEVSFTDGKGYPEGPLASAATAAVTAPTTAGTCPADSDWRATLTMGYAFTDLPTGLFYDFGFNPSRDFGALVPVTIPYVTDYTVTLIFRGLRTSLNGNTIVSDTLSFAVTGGDLPDGTVLNLGATVLTVDTDSATLTAGQEHWSLLALGLSPTWVGGQDYTVCANLPPGLESATVEGTSLVLTYTEDLDASSVPLPGAYSVTVDGAAAAPSSVSVSGSKVTLTLAEAVTAGRSATVEYTPGSNPVQDGSGLDALPLTGEEVDILDETAPEPASGTVPGAGDRLTLTFNEDLDIGPVRVPPPGAFTVKADGDTVTVESVVGSSLDTLALILSSTIKQGQTVTVDYTVPGDDDNPLQDVGGNKTGGFTGFEVDNNSTVEGTPPEPASGTVPPGGSSLTLTFTEDLDIAADSLPPASAFTVKADGDTVTVESVALGTDPDQLVFHLPTDAIKQGRTVTVDYKVPATNPIRDAAGNEAAEFTGFAVDNNSTVEGTPPVLARAAVPTSGASLTLTFNEDLDIGPGKIPPASAFTVKADGVPVAVQSVLDTLSDTFALFLSSTIGARQIVTVSYAVPRAGTVIEDTAGNDAVGFTDFPVTNNSTVANTTPPVPASGAVQGAGSTLTLTFNEDLDIAAVPPASAFTVKADGVEVAVQFVVSSLSDTLALRLSATIGARQIVTVSYAVPTTGTVIADTDGNEAVDFTDFPVTNNSTVANTTPPVPLSAEVGRTGNTLTLTFNEDLDIAADSLPPPGAFKVKVKVKAAGADDDEVTVESVALGTGPDRFVLNLPDDAIKRCHEVTVDYTVPTTNPIQDTDDNDAVGFTGFEVDNNSTVECPSLNPPVFEDPDPRMLTVAENTPGGTAIGAPVTATDADGDTLTYSLQTDGVPFATHFTIDAATGQLRNKKALNYEAGGTSRPNRLGIIVVADDGRGRTAQITVVVDVIDLPEPPGPPGDLTVEGSGTTSLLVTWTAPPNEGRPDILHYDVQYREAGGEWMDGPQDVTDTEATVTPVDAGTSYDVRVHATNADGDGPWALWSGDGAVPVTIEARFDSIGGGLEDLDFTLTRQGDTTDELVATVTIVQDQSWLGDSDLEHEVTFEAGKATADLTIVATKFSFAPSTAGGLTATVSGDGILGGEDTVQIVSTAAPPITVSLDMSAYTFAETDPAEDTAIYLVATLHRDYPEPPAPARDFGIAVSTESGTATFREDFVAIATVVDFLAGDYALVDGQYVARKSIGFAVVDDQVYEGSEDLVVKLEASPNLNRELVQILMPDGTTGDRYPVTVTDGEDVPVLSLSVDPSPIAEEDDDATPAVAENVSTVTVGITNGKTFAEDRTVTLTFSGATRGSHYSVSPADADTNAAGHQAVLPAGDSSVEVTVTAAANDAAGGNRTLTVAGEFDEKVIGRRTITILDDDTTTANSPAGGAPEIGGTPQVGDELTAGIGNIADMDGRPAFPDDYDFQWLRVDTANVETPVGRNLDIYRPVAADVGSRIKVEVRFTDVAGNPEGPLASAAVGPVEPAAVCAVDLGGRTQIWTGTVTVGLLDLGGNPLLYGFGSGFGALDNTQFRVDPNGYTVDVAAVDASGTTAAGRLLFSLTGALAPPDLAQLTLHVCGDSFALADATVESTEHTYSWPGAGLDWSSVTSRTLYLSVPTKTAPVVDIPLADQVATPGTAFSYRVPADTFSDADGDALTYSATRDDGTALPSWLEFDDTSRIFSGTPAVADIGTVAVKVTASDGRGGSVSDAFDIAVALEACVLGGDVWCATLVVQNLGGGHRGCANGQTGKACSNPSRLTEDEFRHDGTDYDVTTVQVRTDGELRLSLSENLTAETGSLVLVVGSERFAFAGATEINNNNRRWAGSGLSWSTGDTVELRLVEGFPPLAPDAPGVNGVDGNDTSLTVAWSKPENAGRPPIAHYDLRYRETGTSGWVDGPQDQDATDATIAGLTMGTEYDVQVRASNADGDGPWSPSGQGTPGVTAKIGDLQLVDGPDAYSGRLEVFLKKNGKAEWGTVCNDRFTSAFDNPNDDLEPDPGNNEDAKVPNVAAQFACQQMGKKTGEMISRPSDIPIARNKPIWLDDVRCAGTVGDDGHTLEMANHWRGSKATKKLNHCYHAGVGLHNCNHSEDVHLQCTGDLSESATQEEEAAALTASFEDLPETHDGATPFTFRLVLSADIANGDADMRDSAFEVTGGSVTGVGRVDGRSDLWEITVTPDGTGNIGIVLAANRECGTAGALCTADGRMLTTAWLGSVTAQPGTGTGTTATGEEGAAALTAQFVDVPAEHDGESKFRFRLVFSDEIFDGTEPLNKNKAVRDALAVTGGVAKGSSRVDKTEFDAYWIVVRPSGNGPVTISLSPASSCGPSSVTCTPDGRKLSAAISARVEGPPGLSVADAEVQEGPGAALAFAVTLDRPTAAAVQVDYATRDGSAQAGSDYTAASGTLRFAPGETAKTVTVAVLDDAHDEGSETLTLVLSNPSGAYLADGEATGTIENSDLMPQAWLSRFGRTVAEQVLEAVEERIRAAPQAGVQVTVAGQRIGAAQAPSEEEAREAEAQARLEDFSAWLRGEACRDDPGAGGDCPARTRSREVTPRDLLTGSSFALTTGAEGIGGGLVSLWGRGAVSSFDGREGDLSLSGEVTGALLGADWTRERWTTGLMMSHARGEGSYRGANSGKVSSTVTGLYPYGRYAVTDRVTVWGAAGYGVGTLTLTPEPAPDADPGDGESTYEADMDLMMAAAGLRGVVVEAPPEGGPELAVKTDAMGVRTSSEATGGSAGGNLAAATADVTRLRLGLEGTWRGLEIGTGTLSPRLEIGVRHDGGDAETGFGLDLGGGLAWSDPGTGIRAEVSGRGLLTHESAGFRERGIAGSFGWDPTPGSDRGPSLTLSQTMGVSARGGADALLGRTTLAGLAANDNGDELERRRLELKLGYGLGALGDRFTSTPEIGFGMSAGHRDYSLAWRFVRDRRRGDIGSLEFSLETRRRESANDDTPPEHTVGLRLTARW